MRIVRGYIKKLLRIIEALWEVIRMLKVKLRVLRIYTRRFLSR